MPARMKRRRLKLLSAAALALLAVILGAFALRPLRPSHKMPPKPSRVFAAARQIAAPGPEIPLAIFATLAVARRGIDCSEDARGCDLSCLAKNVAYVGRYYSSTNKAKTLSRAEGVAISRRGMRIMVFFQNGARSRRSFGAKRGEQNGAAAWNEAHAVGQPPGTAIYFCVDYPAPRSDIEGYILPYFERLTFGMENARRAWNRRHPASPAGRYSPGVYAGPPVIRAILADPKRTLPPQPFLWLAMPPLWQDPREPVEYSRYLKARRWTCWQTRVAGICHRNDQPKAGFPCDEDEIGTTANGSFVLN